MLRRPRFICLLGAPWLSELSSHWVLGLGGLAETLTIKVSQENPHQKLGREESLFGSRHRLLVIGWLLYIALPLFTSIYLLWTLITIFTISLRVIPGRQMLL